MIEKHHKKRLVLFDAHAIIHRAYHALPDFSTKSGEPTGGLYGLVSMVLKTISEFKPDYMIACYDLPEPTFRHKEYKEYKAGRAKADDALVAQLISSRNIFTALAIPIYDKPGFEADDMLGTIVELLKKDKDIEIIICSGDMDTLQLVDKKKVRVYTLKKGLNDTIVYDEDAVNARFGFGPELLPDYKGLRGDPSDNIIGVPGIGEKTATDLITKFGGIEAIYKALHKDKEQLVKEGIKSRMVELLLAHEDEAKFSKTLATIRRDAPIDFALPEKEWKDTFELEAALTLFTALEFRTLGVRLKSIVGEGDGGHADAMSAQTGKVARADAEAVDPELFRKAQIALWLLDSDLTNPTLDDIYEHTGATDFTEAYKQLLESVEKEGLSRVYNEIELPLIPIVRAMEIRGIELDVDYLKKLSEDYHKKLSAFEASIYRHAGETFNINSPKQMGEVLFDRMGLTAKGMKKTAGGARSTRESELEKLRDTHPIIEDILNYRELQKLLSTYIDNLPGMIGEDGRLHTTFHQTGSATGRMSSTNPGLQNIPVREGYGEQIREAFVSAKGKVLIACDYSQIELRVLAILSGDEALTEIFRKGEDIHSSVASRVFGVDPKDVTYEMRRRAKVINFGIIYGMGVTALKGNLGSTLDEAREFYNQYFLTFPTIGKYFEDIKKEAAKQGYTETLFGRRRHFRDIRSKLPFLRAAAERMAMNAPIQGTAADFVKLAMQVADKEIVKAGLSDKIGLLLQVHDELIFEVEDKESTIKKAIEVITSAMQEVNKGTPGENVPLEVSVAKGTRWGSLQ
jgi:DNA polymerase-1